MGEATDCECWVADVSQSGAKISGNITAEVGSQFGITPVPRSALVQSFGAMALRSPRCCKHIDQVLHGHRYRRCRMSRRRAGSSLILSAQPLWCCLCRRCIPEMAGQAAPQPDPDALPVEVYPRSAATIACSRTRRLSPSQISVTVEHFAPTNWDATRPTVSRLSGSLNVRRKFAEDIGSPRGIEGRSPQEVPFRQHSRRR
jgi:hypothetical protein